MIMSITEVKEMLGIEESATKQAVDRAIKRAGYEYEANKDKASKVWFYILTVKQDSEILKTKITQLTGEPIGVPAAWVEYYVDFLKKNGNNSLSDSQVAWMAPASIGRSLKLTTKRSYINRVKNALKSIEVITETEDVYYNIKKISGSLHYIEITEKEFLVGISQLKEIVADEMELAYEAQGWTTDVDIKTSYSVAADELGGYFTRIKLKEINIDRLITLLK